MRPVNEVSNEMRSRKLVMDFLGLSYDEAVVYVAKRASGLSHVQAESEMNLQVGGAK